MKIGIVYNSYTGNTEKVVKKIEEQLLKKEHTVERVELIRKSENRKITDFVSLPELSDFEALVFASHVEAFSLELAMKRYLANIEDVKGKPVVLYLSQGLPKKWMGAKGSLKNMKNLVEAKGANVIFAASVSFSPKRNSQAEIDNVVSEITAFF